VLHKRPGKPISFAAVAVLLAVLALAGQQISTMDSGITGPRMLAPGGGSASVGTDYGALPVPGGPAVVGYAVKHDQSPALREINPATVKGVRVADENDRAERVVANPGPPVKDPVVQTWAQLGQGQAGMPAASVNFEGVPNIGGWYPPDTNGDVGPNNYVQIVNDHFQVWDKRGRSLYGPAPDNAPWAGFGGVCETRNDGDPIANYDPIANRWVISQFALPGGKDGYHQCFAVSATADPTGSYYRYDFLMSNSLFDDYPKVGVWPDAYYATFNMFHGAGGTFAGPWAVAFDRAKMLAGQLATFQYFALPKTQGTLLPADLDGAALPPNGAPGIFANFGANTLNFWRFHVDWTTPANSTFTGPTTLAVAAFNQLCPATSSCVPQPGTTVGLDGLGDRLMYRLAYRNFGDHESLVVNHSVDVGSGQAGLRWYEVRSTPPQGAFSLYQQGTYAPDSTNRWLGSIAMDKQGNIALGYTVSSSTVYPSIRYTGRLAGDPRGTLPQGEATLIAGSGVQTGQYNRWGDYAMMAVDPSDDCTFWLTHEYVQTTGTKSWQTRVGAFKFPGCR
jgi:hypothetical protein